MTPDKDTDSQAHALDSIDRLIHEPARLLIVATLYVLDSADFLFLTNQTGMTFGNLSSHITKLEKGGIVKVKKSFVNKRPNTMLSLTKRGRTAFERYRDTMETVLDSTK